MIGSEKIVRFDIWCPICKHFDKLEEEIPCCECLNEPGNIDTHKPVKFAEDLTRKKGGQ